MIPGVENILVCVTNWIGDSIMSMPALQAMREARPNAKITILAKSRVAELWELHNSHDSVIPLESGFKGTLSAIKSVRKHGFDIVYILPHSFRSAFIPFMAKVPSRVGMHGPIRDWMLTKVVDPVFADLNEHQAYEYLDLLSCDTEKFIPCLEVPDELIKIAESDIRDLPRPLIGLIPGAARGPAKRWPPKHFIELGKLLHRKGFGLALFGGSSEVDLCNEIASSINQEVADFSGKTDLKKWAALMKVCDVIVANDSGGMHLAAALQTPVVAIFGMTNPAKTGPLGDDVCILQSPGTCDRNIKRESAEAQARLAAIQPETVYESVLAIRRQ